MSSTKNPTTQKLQEAERNLLKLVTAKKALQPKFDKTHLEKTSLEARLAAAENPNDKKTIETQLAQAAKLHAPLAKDMQKLDEAIDKLQGNITSLQAQQRLEDADRKQRIRDEINALTFEDIIKNADYLKMLAKSCVAQKDFNDLEFYMKQGDPLALFKKYLSLGSPKPVKIRGPWQDKIDEDIEKTRKHLDEILSKSYEDDLYKKVMEQADKEMDINMGDLLHPFRTGTSVHGFNDEILKKKRLYVPTKKEKLETRFPSVMKDKKMAPVFKFYLESQIFSEHYWAYYEWEGKPAKQRYEKFVLPPIEINVGYKDIKEVVEDYHKDIAKTRLALKEGSDFVKKYITICVSATRQLVRDNLVRNHLGKIKTALIKECTQ